MNSSSPSALDYELYKRCIHSWTSQPLQTEEVREFVNWLLDREAIARTKVIDARTLKKALMGKYECLQGRWLYRGSNFTERLYVGFQALREVGGETAKGACIELQKCPSVKAHLGRSRKGQRSKRRIPAIDRRIETVRSLCNNFRSPFKGKLLGTRVGEYRLNQLYQWGVADYVGFAEHLRILSAHPDLVACQVGEYARFARQALKLTSEGAVEGDKLHNFCPETTV